MRRTATSALRTMDFSFLDERQQSTTWNHLVTPEPIGCLSQIGCEWRSIEHQYLGPFHVTVEYRSWHNSINIWYPKYPLSPTSVLGSQHHVFGFCPERTKMGLSQTLRHPNNQVISLWCLGGIRERERDHRRAPIDCAELRRTPSWSNDLVESWDFGMLRCAGDSLT